VRDLFGVVFLLQVAHVRLEGGNPARNEASADPLDTWRGTVGEYFKERDGTVFRPAREAYARAVAAVLGAPLDREVWEPRFRECLGRHLRPNPHVTETVSHLAATEHHQGVLSDIDADEGQFVLEELGILEEFDAVTTSEEVGRTKPDPAMFETALDRAGVRPERALMVGDRYRHDMEGAAQLGLRTAAYGADTGPAVDYHLESLDELVALLGVGD
jgi:putative hydrolase of the HAD superfamily